MDAIFEQNQVQVAPQKDDAKEAKKARVQAMKDSLKETIQSNPDFTEQLRRLSNSIKVVNTLGFGKDGNIIEEKNSKAEGGRVLKTVSKICGYAVENIGTEGIKYTTEVWTLGEDGKYVGTRVARTFEPGQVIYLTRANMTKLCAIPEISFTLANGKIVQSSSKRKSADLEAELASYYFRFTEEDGTTLAVNDDEVKLCIDDENGKVKEQFVEAFGFLNNPKESKKDRLPKGNQFTVQDMAANLVNQMVKNSEGI